MDCCVQGQGHRKGSELGLGCCMSHHGALNKIITTRVCQPVWPSGEVLMRLGCRGTWVQ